MDKLFKAISDMPPETALSEITEILERLLEDIDSDARERFFMIFLKRRDPELLPGIAVRRILIQIRNGFQKLEENI